MKISFFLLSTLLLFATGCGSPTNQITLPCKSNCSVAPLNDKMYSEVNNLTAGKSTSALVSLQNIRSGGVATMPNVMGTSASYHLYVGVKGAM